MLTRYQFEVLTYLEKEGKRDYQQRELSDGLCISGNQVSECLEFLKGQDFITVEKNTMGITQKGLEALEPYRVKRAVIFAAGFGSRMVPVTLDRPKPLVRVNGKRIIDTLIEALLKSDIKDITLVRGYKKEKFDELLQDYPFIKMIDNDIYDKTNNISSAVMALPNLDQCYICEADLMISNPDIIRKYEYTSNYLGSYSLETDDWCFDMENGLAKNYRKVGKYCYSAYGISYWTKEDSARLREQLAKTFETEEGKDIFWEFIPLVQNAADYQVEIRQCNKTDIIEIDNFYELVLLDPSYEGYKSEGADHE